MGPCAAGPSFSEWSNREKKTPKASASTASVARQWRAPRQRSHPETRFSESSCLSKVNKEFVPEKGRGKNSCFFSQITPTELIVSHRLPLLLPRVIILVIIHSEFCWRGTRVRVIIRVIILDIILLARHLSHTVWWCVCGVLKMFRIDCPRRGTP